MDIFSFCQKMQQEVVAEAGRLDVSGIFCSDLVSWILAHARAGDALCSVNVNENMLAAAKKLNLSCVIACHGSPCEHLQKTAAAREIWLLRSYEPMAELAKKALEILNK